MENTFIFDIKRPIVLPVNLGSNEGVIVYNIRDFGFGYTVMPNPREKVLTISLLVMRKSDQAIVRTLSTFNVTEQGFPSGVILNQPEIDAAIAMKGLLLIEIPELQALIQNLLAQEAAAIEAETDPTQIQEQLAEAQATLATKMQELVNIVIPEPNVLFVNKYSDIIDYFEKDGSITAEGIQWARTVPFLGGTLDDYLA